MVILDPKNQALKEGGYLKLIVLLGVVRGLKLIVLLGVVRGLRLIVLLGVTVIPRNQVSQPELVIF